MTDTLPDPAATSADVAPMPRADVTWAGGPDESDNRPQRQHQPPRRHLRYDDVVHYAADDGAPVCKTAMVPVLPPERVLAPVTCRDCKAIVGGAA